MKGDPHLQRIARSISQLIAQRFGVTIQGMHVAAHKGDPGNEFADNAAEKARLGQTLGSGPAGLQTMIDNTEVKHWEWMWFICRDLPNVSWQGHELQVSYQMGTPGDPSEVLNLCHLGATADQEREEQHYGILDITFATANVLTLKAGLKEDRIGLQGPARQHTIYRQLSEQGIHIAAIQESRIRKKHASQNPWYIVRQSEATPSGCFGMQILFHKELTLGHGVDDEDAKICFTEEQIRYIARTPRYLIVKVTNPLLKAVVIAAHAPHRGATEPEIAQFWEEISLAIPKSLRQWEKIILADANAHVGSIPTRAVGAHQAEAEDDKSARFHDFLVEQELWLPSTFEAHHQGEGGTWWNAKTQQWHRNDYIAIPISWKGTCRTRVNEDIDLSTCKDDHRVAQLRYVDFVRMSKDRRHQKAKCDPVKLAQWASTLTPTDFPAMDIWNLDVHSHAQALECTLEHHLHQNVSRPRQIKRKSHLSEDTWKSVILKRSSRKTLAETNEFSRQTLLRILFTSWKQLSGQEGQTNLVDGYRSIVKELDMMTAKDLHHFRTCGRVVTKMIRKDDNRYFQSIAEAAGTCDRMEGLNKLWKQIRGALPRNRARRMSGNPMSLVNLDDQWHPYYHQLEAGEELQPQRLQADCLIRQAGQGCPRHATPSLSDLPSLCDVEEILRRTLPQKSPGLSSIPTAFFHYAASAIGPMVFDLFMKVYATGREPLQWKGGILAPIYKRGPWDKAESYRAIMLLPTLAKRFHACLRAQLCQQILPHRPEGVLGGFPHQEVHFGAQYLRTKNSLAEAMGKSFGVLFIDIKNAFHNVIREQLTGAVDPQEFEQLIARLNLTSDVKACLREQSTQGILHEMGVSQWLIDLLTEVHHDTWYTMRHDGSLHRTGRGTRPGSHIADLCFHVIMIDMMKDIEERLQDNLWLTTFADIDKSFLNIVWADDVAIPCQTGAPEHLPLAMQRIGQIAGDVFKCRGFKLNFARGKTSAVIALRGAGAPGVRKDYIFGTSSGIDLDGGQEGEFLHFVPRYKHLGVQFVASNAAQLEVDARIGQAKQAFFEMRRAIFGNKHLKIATRLKLVESLIFSRLSFGQCAWPDPTLRQMARIRAFVTKIYREVVGEQFWQTNPLTTEALFGQHRLMDARVRLARDRLQYASRLYGYGPPLLLQALTDEEEGCKRSWL